MMLHPTQELEPSANSVRLKTPEERVLEGLKEQLMHTDLVTAFIHQFMEELQYERAAEEERQLQLRRNLTAIESEIGNLLDAIAQGLYSNSLRDRLNALELQKSDLALRIAQPAIRPVLPESSAQISEIYQQKIHDLTRALNASESVEEAAEMLAQLIEKIVIRPIEE